MDITELLNDPEYEDVIIFKNYSYDDAFIGITEDHRAVYDYEKMIEWLILTEDFTEEEAVEWIDYNTVRSLPYAGERGPIIVYPVY